MKILNRLPLNLDIMKKNKFFITLILSCLFTFNVIANECIDFLDQSKEALDLEKSVSLTTSIYQEFTTPFAYATTWNGKRKVDPKSQHQINGYLIELVSEYFKLNFKLPSEEEITQYFNQRFTVLTEGYAQDIISFGLKKYFELSGSPKSVLNIFYTSLEARRATYKPIYERLNREFAIFFAKHLRAPTVNEFAKITNSDPELIKILISDRDKFIKKSFEASPESLEVVRNLLASAYLRALQQKDLEEKDRTQPTTPSYESLFIALSNSKIPVELKNDIKSGSFKLTDLIQLVESDDEASSTFSVSVFSNLKGLENLVRSKNPTAFKNFIPAEIYNPEKVNNFLKALKTKQGFLVTSVNAGMPINEPMFYAMLKYAKDKNYDIIIIPTAGILDSLDGRFFDHPNIHILTHTIENKFLKLWNIPILPKNQNSLASLDNPKQHKPMQTIIVGHPALTHKNIPTSTNDYRATALWSTGSLSMDNYPFMHAAQGRTSQLAKNHHTNSFLVLEKADGETGVDKEGVANFWHTRPVYFNDDTKINGTSGFNDLNIRYFVQESDKYNLNSVKKTSNSIDTLVLGDLHERISDPIFIKAVIDYIKSHPEIKRIVLHDPIDGGSHNRHEAKSIALLKAKFKSGELDYHKEMMGLVQIVNAITNIRPSLAVIVADSNHSYWGSQLINSASEFQEIANGHFITELRYAIQTYGVSDPLDYVFSKRNDHILSLPLDVQQKILRETILVANPEQVIVLPNGRNFTVGPEHRPTHINFHGHQGGNGAKPSPKTHAIGSESSVTGDSHQSYILGQWMSVGTATYIKVGYNDGGYSSWSNSFVIINDDGSKQLMTYSSETGTFSAREGKLIMTEEEFFGDNPLEIKANDNDVVKGHIVDQHTQIIDALSRAGRTNRD